MFRRSLNMNNYEGEKMNAKERKNEKENNWYFSNDAVDC